MAHGHVVREAGGIAAAVKSRQVLTTLRFWAHRLSTVVPSRSPRAGLTSRLKPLLTVQKLVASAAGTMIAFVRNTVRDAQRENGSNEPVLKELVRFKRQPPAGLVCSG